MPTRSPRSARTCPLPLPNSFLDGAWIEPKRTVRRLLIEEEGFEPALVDEAMHGLEEGE
jgi:hypothetical protein